MLCEKCSKNEATVFYREIVNGKEKKYSLCSDCAAKLEKEGKISFGADMPFGNFFNDYDPMGSLFGSLFAPSFSLQPKSAEQKKCPLCGSTFEELVENGKVGCPKCYEAFADELEPTVRSIHGKTKHTGRAPGKLKAKIDRMKQISSLESEMKDAIKAQNFERAAEIRDQLKELKDSEK